MRNFMPCLLLLVLLTLPGWLSGCGGGGEGSTSLALSGYVVDDGTRAAIRGATVAAEGQSVASGSDGSFVLTNLTRNPVPLTVEAAGYETLSTSVQVIGGAMSIGTLGLPPNHIADTGNVRGNVTLNGSRVAGALVIAATREAQTDAQGAFTVYNVPAGAASLIAASADRASIGSVQVTVVADTTVSAGTIQLNSGPPLPPL